MAVLVPGAATLPYWRAGIAVAAGNLYSLPPAPLGMMLVAVIHQNKMGPGGRRPTRVFYLSAIAPPGFREGVDRPKDAGATYVVPGSIQPGLPGMESAISSKTRFGFNSDNRDVLNAIEKLLRSKGEEWKRYADFHGFTLPDRETFDGSHIPY